MYIGKELDYLDKPHWAVAGSLAGGSCLTDWSCYSGDSPRRTGDVWWTWSWSSAAVGGSSQGDTEYSGSPSGQRSHCLLSTWECLLRRMRQLVKQIMTYCKYMYIPTCNNTCKILYMNDNNFLRIHNKLPWYPFWHIPVWYREAIWSWPACWYTCHEKQTHSLHKFAPRKTGPWKERINRILSPL